MEKSIEITKNERVFFYSAYFMSELLGRIHIFSSRANHIMPGHISLSYAAQFLRHCLEAISLPLPLKPGGTSFNTQNPIPHKSQKTKGFLETSRAKEFSRGTAQAEERAKEGGRVASEGSDTHLGAGGREFESRHSDHVAADGISFAAAFFAKKGTVHSFCRGPLYARPVLHGCAKAGAAVFSGFMPAAPVRPA